MGLLPSADLTSAYPGVALIGLGVGNVESFTAYVVRLGNAFAVLASEFLTHSINSVLPPAHRDQRWLAGLDACPVHGCLLESRCGTCGHLQPSLTRGVRLNTCSYCGHELSDSSSATVLPSGPAAQRLLWYARQEADLIHAAEVVALMQSDEAASLNAAYAHLATKARNVGLREVASEFEKMRTRRPPRAGWVEAFFSALWRLNTEVLALFSPAIQEAVRGSRSGSG